MKAKYFIKKYFYKKSPFYTAYKQIRQAVHHKECQMLSDFSFVTPLYPVNWTENLMSRAPEASFSSQVFRQFRLTEHI